MNEVQEFLSIIFATSARVPRRRQIPDRKRELFRRRFSRFGSRVRQLKTKLPLRECAAEDVKKAEAVAVSDQQKQALKPLLDRLQANQDINK